jgi:NodT family efflux transporter outer membrane factor (OMF) lipoprotein
MTSRWAASVGLASLAVGCTVGPQYHEPPPVAADALARGGFVRAQDPSFSIAPGISRWWESLGDPILTRLEDRALADSPNIEVATAKIREARAQVREQQASDIPSVKPSATYGRAKLPGTSLGSLGTSDGGSSPPSTVISFYDLGLTASWEPDLFGATRRSVEEAKANVGARFADLADAQVSLTAQVAQAYVNLRDTQTRLRLNQDSSQLQQRQLSLNEQRERQGTTSKLDLDRQVTQLENTKAQIVPLAAEVEQYMNQLATLTGQSPGALDELLAPAASVPLPPPSVAVGDPAALIANRPDIRSAERSLASSTASIGAAKAKLFPSVSFIGVLGLGGSTPSDMFNIHDLTTLLAPSLTWDVSGLAKNQAAVHAAEAERDQAQAQYRKAVLDALQDAETSLSRFGHYREQLAGLMRAKAAADSASALNSLRVRAGTSSTLDQLDIERQQLSAAISVAQGTAALTNSYIAVQKSLGLGWQ